MPRSSPDSPDRWTLIAAGAILALAAFLLPTSPTVDETALLRERQRADSLYRALLDAKAQRDGTTIVAQQAQRQVRRTAQGMGLRLERVQQITQSGVETAERDSLVAVITTVRAEVDTLVTTQATLVAELDSLDRTLVAERNAAEDALTAASATIVAYRTALDASQVALERSQTGCQVLGRPCPTRTQAMAAGAVLTLLAVVVR